ncbi:MAG: hypothetical protein ABIN94_06490 [Ferruginibacter sp.]
MKIRIKGNSLRIRLSKPEVNKLALEGYLQELTIFTGQTLIYAVEASNSGEELTAEFIDNKITMYVPGDLLNDWPVNATVGFQSTMPLNKSNSLFLKLEKDFACIDATTEDQSDNYENPGKIC